MLTFSKAERLCSKTVIAEVIESGRSFSFPPFRITWSIVKESPEPVQVLISVPKRLFRKAVHRNRIKRLIREVYRKNKNLLSGLPEDHKIRFIIVYTSSELPDYRIVEEKLTGALKKLRKIIEEKK